MEHSLLKKFFAELLGTAVLVLFACGTAVVCGGDYAAIALAFGLVIVGLAYTIGHVSGCHINPAVSFAMALNKRMSWKNFGVYVLAQFIGATVGAGLLWLLVGPLAGNDAVTILGQNNYDYFSFADNAWIGAVVTEILLTFVFVLVIMAVTGKAGAKGVGKKAGLVIGLTLTLVHLFGIGLTGTSVNPARSFGPAILLMGTAAEQLWPFIVAPMIGAALAAVVAKFLLNSEADPANPTENV